MRLDSRQRRENSYSQKPPRPAPGPIRPPTECIPRALSTEAKRLGREATNHLHLASRLRMGVIPLLSLHTFQKRNKNNFTFAF